MNRLLDVGLEELMANLSRMGQLAERTIGLSIVGFMEGIEVSDRVARLSETLVNMSTDIEDKAFELIAKYQPVASDLRIIKSYMKIGYDLERYGRYAWDITFIHKRLAKSERFQDWDRMQDLTNKVMKMVKESIRALRNHDAQLAKGLAETEDQVDALYFAYLDYISQATCPTQHLVANLLVVRYLERIADHATYIGESIVYLATGKKIVLR